ncbi:transposase [Rhizobium acaciae]|uniref:transposase n=1 Tax=Rhizobium acaciae TaxID=2989736 RepID=UPI00221EF866|nr:transposase [Rhizobium acaciae]MCW1755037.1 transposase [Rhizobium acaciae]
MTITGFTPSTKTDETVQRFEVFTGAGRRRDWSDEEKRQIVAESHSGEMSVSAVARRHGLSPGQLFTWRRGASASTNPLTFLTAGTCRFWRSNCRTSWSRF